MTDSFERLFNPRGIAVVGASGDGGRLSGQTLPALLKFGYKGGIYPVNPKYDSLFGVKCFKSLGDIDGECDVAVVVVSAGQVPGIIEQCGQKGIRFAVVLGGGFREAGPKGVALESDMVAKARLHGVRIIGPNCIGLLNGCLLSRRGGCEPTDEGAGERVGSSSDFNQEFSLSHERAQRHARGQELDEKTSF